MELKIPDFFKQLLVTQYGEKLTDKIIQGYNKQRYTTFRINTLQSNNEEIENALKIENIEYKKVNWYKDAYIIKNIDEHKIKTLKIYEDGKIYMQSLSSMIPPIILNPQQGSDILDMTAAPGGKTTQIAAMTNNKANITACEMNKIRAEKLKYNIEKQKANVYVMIQDARMIDNFFAFDQILLDAPCSGSGTLNANEDFRKNFTQKLIDKSNKAQIVLLRKAIEILKKNHEMIYSTCSILESENEKIIENLIKEKKIEIVPIKDEWINNLPLLPTKIEGTICICPNEYYEGFFVAKIKKI